MVDFGRERPYPAKPPKPKPCREPELKRPQMTLALAMKLNDGLVFGADSLMTHGTASEAGSFAHYEMKNRGYDGRYFSASIVGAGDAVQYRSLALAVMLNHRDAESEDAEILPNTKEILEAQLSDLASKIGAIPSIITLVGCVKPYGSQIELLKTHNLVVENAEPFEVIGIGEESLVNYLKDRVFRRNMSLQEAAVLAVHILQVGKEYCPQYCGGPSDVEILKLEYPLRVVLTAKKIAELELRLREGAKRHLQSLIVEGAGLPGSFE
jgi:20S proteasome alpha/beta subunit